MKAPYQLVMAMSIEKRHRQMAECLKYDFPRLRQKPIDESASLSIACYGPSLADTYQDLTHPIISMSGATHFLAEKGIIPDYHIDMDPRPHKWKHLHPPVKGTKYLMASVCSPRSWEILQGQDVAIWHINNGKGTKEWLETFEWRECVMVTAGSTIGLAAIQIGGLLGFRHFEIHGMDSSMRDGQRHAGPHYGHKQGGKTWDAGGITYQTSKIMANAAAEVINCMHVYPIFCVFHGKGLQQGLIAEEPDLPNVALAGTPQADIVRKARCQIVGYKNDKGEYVPVDNLDQYTDPLRLAA